LNISIARTLASSLTVLSLWSNSLGRTFTIGLRLKTFPPNSLFVKMEKNRIKICAKKNGFILYKLLWWEKLAASGHQSNRSLIIHGNVRMYKEIYWFTWVYAVKCNSKSNADWQRGWRSCRSTPSNWLALWLLLVLEVSLQFIFWIV